MTRRPIKPLPPDVPPQEEQTKWVAYFLRRTIHNRDTTITQLAHALAVDRSTIYHWFQGKLPVTMIRLIYWIYNDSNPQDIDTLRDEDYWRARCLRAERHLALVAKALTCDVSDK